MSPSLTTRASLLDISQIIPTMTSSPSPSPSPSKNSKNRQSKRGGSSGGLLVLHPPGRAAGQQSIDDETRELRRQQLTKEMKEMVEAQAREEIEAKKKARPLLRADIISNAFLAIGGIAFVVISARTLLKCCGGRGLVADIFYFTGSVTFFISGGIQLIIDVLWTRSSATGRYTTHRYWNFFISFLFLSGVIIDTIAFFFWRQGGAEGIQKERTAQWFSSHLWLFAALIVVFTNLRLRNSFLEDKMDALGNLCFFLEAVMNVCASYVSDSSPEEGDDLFDPIEVRLELAAASFWTFNAIFYLSGASIRLRKYRKDLLPF